MDGAAHDPVSAISQKILRNLSVEGAAASRMACKNSREIRKRVGAGGDRPFLQSLGAP
jgi:hypothetical protein